MPTSGPLPITPLPGFFPAARTMFSPPTSARFWHLWEGHNDGRWDNDTKTLMSNNHWSLGSHIGYPMHVWKSPGPIEDWDIVADIIPNHPYPEWYLPNIDLPTGTLYNWTLGKYTPLNLQGLFARLWKYWHTSAAYAVRYRYLWTTVEPEMVLHGFHVIHFNGWPD